MLAAIDVGSNTVRMLLGEVIDGRVVPKRYDRTITRLKGGQSNKGLAPDAMERTFIALRDFSRTLVKSSPSHIRLVGTEALRSAPNARELSNRIASELNLALDIISGEEEALLCAAGVMSALEPQPGKALILDIGGGSTEFILQTDDRVVFRYSCPLGVVRLAELDEASGNDIIERQLRGALSAFADKGMGRLARSSDTKLVGTAGTITTLAAIDLEMAEYDWRRVSNHLMPRQKIESILQRIYPLSACERERSPGIEEGRGDLILPGLLILRKVMDALSKPDLIVSDFGLLEGVLLQMVRGAAID